MNILMFSRDANWYGGVVNFVRSLCNNFTDEVNVNMFRIGLRRSKAGRIFRFFIPLIDSIRLIQSLRKGEIDIVHMNPSLESKAIVRDFLYLFILNMFKFKNIVFFIHGWDLRVEEYISNNTLVRTLFIKNLNKVGSIIVLSSKFSSVLFSWGVRKDLVHVFSTMYEGGRLDSSVIDKDSKCTRIVFLSRFVKEKGVFELIEAFSDVLKSYDNVELYCVGDGPELDSMVDLCNELEIDHKVKFPGYITGKEKESYLLCSDIFAFPSYTEGCPIVILEAMAAGLPIVASDVGGIPDIVEDGINGQLLHEVTPNNLSKALKNYLDDEDLRHSVGAINRIKAIENYEATIVTQKVESLYKKLMAS